MKDTPFEEQARIISYYLTNYNFSQVNIDATWARAFAEGLGKISHAVNEVIFTNDVKQSMVFTLKRIMQNGRLSIPDDSTVINSIRAIRRKHTEGNIIRFDSERRADIGHADLFWALALAVYGAEYSAGAPTAVKLKTW